VATPSEQANERALRASRLFAGLDAAILHALATTAERRHLERGAHVWRAGATATRFTVILSGLVKIVRSASDGTETIVAIFGPRESIGDIAVLQQGTYPADAVAASESLEILRVDAGPVLAAKAANPAVSESITRTIIEHTQALHQKIRIMSAGSIPKRLATLLLHLAERFGDEEEGGATFVPIVLSRTELARLVGATVETTIRAMSRWNKEQLLSTTPEGFRIPDIEKLVAITTGASPG
jgi:CRP-like cAMP-binding protein